MSITKQFLKLLFVSTLIVIYSYAVSANNHRPIISVFSIKTPKLNLKFSEIMKNSVLHSLSEKNFLTQDGNKTYRYFDNNNFVRIDEVISNNAFKDRSDGELILFLKLDIINVNIHDYLLELGAEVYNLKSDNFLTSWTIPKKKILLPSNCDSICKNIKFQNSLSWCRYKLSCISRKTFWNARTRINFLEIHSSLRKMEQKSEINYCL